MPDLHRLPFYALAGIQDLICKNYFTLPMRCQGLDGVALWLRQTVKTRFVFLCKSIDR
jgi:hypothetical protein